MDYHTTIGSDGMMQLPKSLIKKMNLHPGDNLVITSHKNQMVIKADSKKKHKIDKFFGMGSGKTVQCADVDQAISQTVIENDQC